MLSENAISSIHAFARGKLSANAKLEVISNADSSDWPNHFPLTCSVFISALGTNARKAGGFANQRKIDYDLNLALAKAAKAQGVRIYVLFSTAGANVDSIIPYAKMRGELDEAIKAVDFEHTIILRPGLLVGTRSDSRPGEYAGRRMATFLGWISGDRLKDPWAQDADVVAKAALSAALEALEGKNTEKMRLLSQSDIIRLGRTERRNPSLDS